MGPAKIETLLVVLAIILLLFGAKKLPQLARSVGESVKELKKGFSDAAGDKSDKKTETKKSDNTEA